MTILSHNIFTPQTKPTPANSNRVLVISIVRLVKLVQLFYVPGSIPDPFHDIGAILNVVEINIAIISASGPALRGLLRRWLPTWFGGSSGGKYGRYGTASSRRGTKYGRGTGYGRGTTRSHVYNNNEDYTADGLGHTHTGGRGGSGGGIALKNMHHRPSHGGHTEIRSISPSGSEEEIMTYNGIMRTTDVQVHYDREGDAGTTEAGSTSRASSDLKFDEVGPKAL